jgi:hypothetical protein
MSRVGGSGDVFESPPFSTAAGANGLLPGMHAVEIRALDPSANMATLRKSYDFAFDVPEVTRISPAEIGHRSQPFTVDVEATARLGLESIALMIVPRSAAGTYPAANATRAGITGSSPASFRIDPTALMDGDYLIYAVVKDRAGNALVRRRNLNCRRCG